MRRFRSPGRGQATDRNAGVLEALFDGEPAAAPIEAGLAVAAEALGVTAPAVEVARLEARDWLAENRAALTEIAVGRFRIVPEHRRRAVPQSHLLDLHVDAGPAFGSGRHETTQGCLRLLEEIARTRRPRRILDIGAGSGILALAAAQAVEAARGGDGHRPDRRPHGPAKRAA